MRAPHVSLMPSRIRETVVTLIPVRSAIHTGIFISWFRTKHEIHGTCARDAAAFVMELGAPAGERLDYDRPGSVSIVEETLSKKWAPASFWIPKIWCGVLWQRSPHSLQGIRLLHRTLRDSGGPPSWPRHDRKAGRACFP
jgi:hypothetical protein